VNKLTSGVGEFELKDAIPKALELLTDNNWYVQYAVMDLMKTLQERSKRDENGK
jgi:hypothetical protein